MPHHELITIKQSAPGPSWAARVRSAAVTAWHELRFGSWSSRDPELRRLFGGAPTSAGIEVSEAAALGVPAFRRGVQALAGDISTLPLIIWRGLPGGGRERAGDHYLYDLLHAQPNPEMSSADFRGALQEAATLHGNGYAEIERDNGARPIALWPLDVHRVRVVRERGQLTYRHINEDGREVTLAPYNVTHLRGPGPNGLVGASLLVEARDALASIIAAERFAAKFFANATHIGGTVKHPKVLGDAAQKNLRESLNALHGGADKAHKTLILEEGAEYAPLQIDAQKSQLLELRQYAVRECSRLLGVPPSRLGDSANLSYATSQEESLSYYSSGIRPWLVRWEQELNRKLLSKAERLAGVVIEHVADGILRVDPGARADIIAKQLGAGVLSLDEARKLENLPPLPNGLGALPRVPLNTSPVNAPTPASQEAA